MALPCPRARERANPLTRKTDLPPPLNKPACFNTTPGSTQKQVATATPSVNSQLSMWGFGWGSFAGRGAAGPLVVAVQSWSISLSPFLLHILEGASTRNSCEAIVEKNAADSVAIPPGASRSRGRQGTTSGISCNYVNVAHHVAHLERIQTWSTRRAIYSRARSPRCAPQTPNGLGRPGASEDLKQDI